LNKELNPLYYKNAHGEKLQRIYKMDNLILDGKAGEFYIDPYYKSVINRIVQYTGKPFFTHKIWDGNINSEIYSMDENFLSKYITPGEEISRRWDEISQDETVTYSRPRIWPEYVRCANNVLLNILDMDGHPIYNYDVIKNNKSSKLLHIICELQEWGMDAASYKLLNENGKISKKTIDGLKQWEVGIGLVNPIELADEFKSFKIIKDYQVIGNIEKLYKNNQINKTIYNLWKANK